MLGKLLKHEFRATGRIMLPVFAALLVLSVPANISMRMLDSGMEKSPFLSFLFIFLIVIFGLGVFGTVLATLWLMVSRFYRNLLKDEGYLMHTLPVNVHGLVWSKLIVSLVWFLVTMLVIFLIGIITVMLQTGTGLSAVLQGFPSWAEIKAALAEQGLGLGDCWLLLFECLAVAAVGFFASCLHFYAAMAMGHMFNKDKILLSIVFFVLLSLALSLFTSMSGLSLFRTFEEIEVYTGRMAMDLAQRSILYGIFIEAVQGALLYFATVLSLRRGLNLA